MPCQLYSPFYNSFSKFQANHTLKITSSQPKFESQAGNSPHLNSQFHPPHLQTQAFQVSTIIEYYFPKTTLQSLKTQKQHSEDKKLPSFALNTRRLNSKFKNQLTQLPLVQIIFADTRNVLNYADILFGAFLGLQKF